MPQFGESHRPVSGFSPFRYPAPVIYCRSLNRFCARMDLDMNEQFADIRPVTRALKQLSAARLAKGKGHYDGTHHGALLLLEPGCTELPSAIPEDSVPQPVDKIVLLVVMMIARRSSGDAFLPTQAKLARMANVSSPDTVSMNRPGYSEDSFV